MTDEQAELERRVRAGEWLGVVAVATLLGVNRSSVDEWMSSGRVAWRRHGIRNRKCRPEDVLRILDESRHIHGGSDETAGQEER